MYARLRFMKKSAYIIPLALLAYILCLNYLPFGYDRTFVIEAGKAGDRDGQFFLDTSEGLSPRMTAADGSTYRELSGFVYAVFKPKAILRNATATVTVSDEGVYLISPWLDVQPDTLDWQYNLATASSTNGCTYFNGSSTRLSIPSSETSPDGNAFTVYTEWTPADSQHAAQLIVGHYHWELLQNKDDVQFYIRTMEGKDGIRSIRYPINDSEFFNKKHSALAIYAPANKERLNGYIDLYIDNRFAGRTYFGFETVLKEGLAERDITLGKSGHSDASFFKGCINDLRMMKSAVNTTSKEVSFKITREEKEYNIPMVNMGSATSTLKHVTLHAIQK
jgi:hypothetical protein